MTNDNKIEHYLKELRRLTGLPLTLDLQEGADTEAAMEQLSSLHKLCLEANDRERIIAEYLLGERETASFLAYAVRTHLDPDSARSLFLIQLNEADTSSAAAILKNVFPDTSSTIFSVRPNQLVLVRELKDIRKFSARDLAFIILNTLNAELMTPVSISYGPAADHLEDLQDAFREAELSLKAGSIFYPDRSVYGFDEADLGALIYELPEDICSKFISRNLGDRFLSGSSVFFDDEILRTADCFLRCNLNIAETSRQLHVHRNTLLYRLEQIQNETGLDIRRFDSAMTFRVCSMILHYLHQIGRI